MDCSLFLGQSICDFLGMVGNLRELPIVIGGLAILGLIPLLFKPMCWIFRLIKDKNLHKKLSELENEHLIASYQDTDFLDARKNYIEPDCSNLDPTNSDDSRYFVGVKENIFTAINSELNSNNSQRHILILADSGMGKTTLLLNIFAREQKSKNKRRMALIPLGRGDADEHIKKITNQRETILLLDSFDEDTLAIKNYKQRMSQLMKLSENFKAVLLTCRTQFFSQDNDIPKETGIMKVAARRAGVATVHEWKTVYLLPFNDQKIDNYVKQVIPFYNFGRRKMARKIVKDIPDLAVRPMLLTLIPELADAKANAHNLWDLYKFMVDSWVERESNWFDPEKLKSISKHLAVDLVLNRELRKGERIPLNELIELTNIDSGQIESWKLTGRSLLNRDANGNYKFAHRSILEFLFILAFVEGDNRCVGIRWTDLMCELFLSWGNNPNSSSKRAMEILNMDLRATSLFPIEGLSFQISSLDANWVKKALANNGYKSVPRVWLSSTSRIIEQGNLVRVYDYSLGLIFQFINTIGISSEDLEPFRNNRTVNKWVSINRTEWIVPRLSEFVVLLDILAMKQKLDLLDDRELYWLGDNDGEGYCLVRFRRVNMKEEEISFQHLNLISSTERIIDKSSFFIDVYYSHLKRTHLNTVTARSIMLHQGEADDLWHRDMESSDASDWQLTANN